MSRRRVVDCTFCGDRGVFSSSEDVFPQWLIKKLAHVAEVIIPGVEPRFVHHTYDDPSAFRDDMRGRSPGDRGVGKRRLGAKPVAYKLPEVCDTCNRGWMSRLEEVSKNVMMGFVEGRGKVLDPFDQLYISMWAVKTCLTYDACQEQRYVGPDVGSRRLFMLGYPLPGAHVLIGHDPDLVPEKERSTSQQDESRSNVSDR